MQCLCQHAFTSDQRWGEHFEAFHGPGMVEVRAIEQRDKRSCISQMLFHFRERPKDCIRILLTERSPSLLAPSFFGSSNRSRVSSKQLPGATASLSRDIL